MFVNEFGNPGRSIVNLYSVCFYVHLTADGKRMAHDRHLLQSVVPLATFLLDHSKTDLKSWLLWQCVEKRYKGVVLRVPANREMSVYDPVVACL